MGFFSKRAKSYLADPDVQLMLAFKGGDDHAFEQLMRKHYRSVINFVARFTGQPTVAEDLSQEIFMRIYRSRSRYAPKARFRTWMFTIARNVCLNEIRRISNTADRFDGGGLEEGSDPLAVADASMTAPEDQLLAQERRRIIARAIDALPHNQRSAVLLRRFEDFSYAEIAAVLNVSQKAVKSLLSRAKVNLKQRLGHLADD